MEMPLKQQMHIKQCLDEQMGYGLNDMHYSLTHITGPHPEDSQICLESTAKSKLEQLCIQRQVDALPKHPTHLFATAIVEYLLGGKNIWLDS